eukprot:1678099-Rhodomonas_salina.2
MHGADQSLSGTQQDEDGDVGAALSAARRVHAADSAAVEGSVGLRKVEGAPLSICGKRIAPDLRRRSVCESLDEGVEVLAAPAPARSSLALASRTRILSERWRARPVPAASVQRV